MNKMVMLENMTDWLDCTMAMLENMMDLLDCTMAMLDCSLDSLESMKVKSVNKMD